MLISKNNDLGVWGVFISGVGGFITLLTLSKIFSGVIAAGIGLLFSLIGLIMVFMWMKQKPTSVKKLDEFETLGDGYYILQLDDLPEQPMGASGKIPTVCMQKMTVHFGTSAAYNDAFLKCLAFPIRELETKTKKFKFVDMFDVYSKDSSNKLELLASTTAELKKDPFLNYKQHASYSGKKLKMLRFEESIITEPTAYLMGYFHKDLTSVINSDPEVITDEPLTSSIDYVLEELDDVDFDDLHELPELPIVSELELPIEPLEKETPKEHQTIYEVSNGVVFDDIKVLEKYLKKDNSQFFNPALVLSALGFISLLLSLTHILGF